MGGVGGVGVGIHVCVCTMQALMESAYANDLIGT